MSTDDLSQNSYSQGQLLLLHICCSSLPICSLQSWHCEVNLAP
uniref:Uncharacterized protein n=1 Tax=Arundo donax TaxID=35708 RepID=A0A0A9EXE7_ARUDO